MFFLLGCIEESIRRGVQINQKQFPDGVRKLIDLSQAVPEKQTGRTEEPTSFLQTLGHNTREVLEGVNTFLAFTGEVTMGFARIFGKNKVFRSIDFITVLYQCSAAATNRWFDQLTIWTHNGFCGRGPTTKVWS